MTPSVSFAERRVIKMYILPKPQKMIQEEQRFFFSYDDEIAIDTMCSAEIYTYACMLQEDIQENVGFKLNITRGNVGDSAIKLKMDCNLKNQEYEIRVDEHGILLFASANEGMLYGIQTLRQIILQEGAAIPYLVIRDYPEMSARGLYYDITRCRIPTLDYLKKLVDILSYYKINQFQLYIEHTYMFKDLSEVWRDDTPLTAQEILELDEYCAVRNIELVPSIATFGHLYKVLRTKTYRHLCEKEELCDKPFGFVDRMEHHTIDISNEESFVFIKSLIDEYLPLFRSQKFNICGDETMDLGTGKGKKLAEELGEENMYILHVSKLCEYLVKQGKTPMFWGDIICKFPEAIQRLPEETICMNWGYDADVDDKSTKELAHAGARLYNCPGVSGWDQLVNQIQVSYENIKKMCTYAFEYQAEGILNTDWGDCGHVNHPDMGIIGIIYGACFSWNREIPGFDEINRQISVVEFRDSSEAFVKMLADISKLWEYKWRNLVNLKEHRESVWSMEQLEAIKDSKKQLKEKKRQLLSYISKMDGQRKSTIRPYVLAIDGMILLQQIGIALILLERCPEKVDRASNIKLAQKVEKWFYHYKTEWRRVSKESELYRIQEVIFWIADYLREGSKA